MRCILNIYIARRISVVSDPCSEHENRLAMFIRTKRISLKKSIMIRIGIAFNDTKDVRTTHEWKLYYSPVGEQNCTHGMVQKSGSTEESNIV